MDAHLRAWIAVLVRERGTLLVVAVSVKVLIAVLRFSLIRRDYRRTGQAGSPARRRTLAYHQ